jgi:hypothetical protein
MPQHLDPKCISWASNAVTTRTAPRKGYNTMRTTRTILAIAAIAFGAALTGCAPVGDGPVEHTVSVGASAYPPPTERTYRRIDDTAGIEPVAVTPVPAPFLGRISEIYATNSDKYGTHERVTGRAAAAHSVALDTWFVAVEFRNTDDELDAHNTHTGVWAVSGMDSSTALILSVDHWAGGYTIHPAPKAYVADPAAFAAWRAVETDPYVYLS